MHLKECFVDATVAAVKGRGAAVGLTRKGKGTKFQLIVDSKEFRWRFTSTRRVWGTSMFQQTLALADEEVQSKRFIGGKGEDSDALNMTLAELGIDMISPYSYNRSPQIVT